jgi:toxin YoeB
MLSAKFDPAALEEYIYWQTQDRKTLKKINELLKEILRNPFEGTGKPEPLKNNLTGYWSRRIDSQNRLVYRVVDDCVELHSCRSHYE